MDVDPDPLPARWLQRGRRRRSRSTHEEVPVAGMQPTVIGAQLPVVSLQERIALDTQTGCQPERHSPLARGGPGEKPEGEDCDKTSANQAGHDIGGTVHGASTRKAAQLPNVRRGTGSHKVVAFGLEANAQVATV